MDPTELLGWSTTPLVGLDKSSQVMITTKKTEVLVNLTAQYMQFTDPEYRKYVLFKTWQLSSYIHSQVPLQTTLHSPGRSVCHYQPAGGPHYTHK